MNGASCERAWQAEAARDGRFSDADRASFERHAASCAVCTRELSALVAIEDALRSLPAPASSALDRRRARHQLLRRANEIVVREPTRPARRVVLAAALAACAGLLGFALLRPSGSPGPLAAPTYRLQASEQAEFALVDPGATLRLDVRRGRFELDVDPLKAGQRFLLSLPDGELEVQGTHFVVEVDRTATRGVRVTEGRVALRLRDRTPVVLSAGESWPKLVAVEPPASAAPVVPEVAAPKPELVTRPRRLNPPAPSASAAPPSAGSAFAAAMDAFGAGDFARAEALFATFEAQHPRDARVEDATFLRAVARSRRGDGTGAQALARDYLRRYPKGLRRLEAERLAGTRER